MEVSKLFNIILDIDNDEKNKAIQTDIENLSQYIINNNSEEIQKVLEKIKLNLEKSMVNNYVPSDLDILQKIGGIKYFGNIGFEEISKILNNNSYNTQKIHDDLQKYKKERENFLSIAKSTRENLKFLNIEYPPPNEMS